MTHIKFLILCEFVVELFILFLDLIAYPYTKTSHFLITLVLFKKKKQKNLVSWKASHLILYFLVNSVLDILDTLLFHVNFRTIFIFYKNLLQWEFFKSIDLFDNFTTLNPLRFSRIDNFTILDLLIHKVAIPLHLVESSLMPLNKALQNFIIL